MLNRLLIITLCVLFLFCHTRGQSLWDAPLQKCWNFPLAEAVNLVASDNDSILISSLNQLSLINYRGQFIWSNPNRTTPVQIDFQGDRILELSTQNGNTSQLSIKSLSKQTGLPMWQQTIDTIIDLPAFSINQHQIEILNGNELFRLNLNDGSNLQNKTLATDSPRSSMLTNKMAYLFLDQKRVNVYSIVDGRLLKSFKAPSEVSYSSFSDDITILSNDKGQIFILEKDKELWNAKLGGQITSAHFNRKNVAVASNDNYFYQFSQESGNVVWKKRFSNRISTTFSPENNIFAVAVINEATIEIVNAEDGKTINQLKLTDESLPRESRVLIKDNLLIILGREKIQAFSPQPCK